MQKIPPKYIIKIDKKVKVYYNRISTKTEKTLTRLSKWEYKIHRILLKVDPIAAEKLFGNNQLTFALLLDKVKKNEMPALIYQHTYDKYQDDLSIAFKYLIQQKAMLDSAVLVKVKNTNNRFNEVVKEEQNNQVIDQFIQERKKQIAQQALKQLGKSRYLSKINKEAYYFTETLQNYKDQFSNSQKTEETVKEILSNIPAFQKFCMSNSQIAGLFSSSSAFPNLSSGNMVPIINGIPSRSTLQCFMQSGMPSNNTNPLEQLQLSDTKETTANWQKKIANLQPAENEVQEFKPNKQPTKSFKKRLEYGIDYQFYQSESSHPAVANITTKIGYKINDKNSAGIGVNYLMGLGYGWNKIHLSNEGIGLRTYLKRALTKGMDIQGGAEWNHQHFTGFRQLSQKTEWQQAAVIGLAKNYTLQKKLKGSIQILYDFLATQHLPSSAPLLFRFGYVLN